jgi:SAM-dependent methyltransferase
MLVIVASDASWLDTMPGCYDRDLGPALFAPYGQHLAAMAAESAPRSVLEIAAGTGIVTAELVRALPGAVITATDLNPAMVAAGEQRVSGVSWQVADAQSLPFPPGAFDLIVCQFGVMFFPDKVAAFAQAGHVLRPGGRYLFAVWDRAERSRFPAALVASLTELFPDDRPDFIERIPHGYHDPEQVGADVVAGGLELERIDRVGLRGTATSARVVAEGYCLGTPLRFALQERGNLGQLTEAVVEQMTRRLGSGPVDGDLSAFVVSARRPGPNDG